MSLAGKAHIGQKAPDFRCEAIFRDLIAKVSLGTFIHLAPQPGVAELESPWLILMFVPTAFSFVCQTEVLAFQDYLHEFRNRNCTIIFVSTETKHTLWHWTHVPSDYGGLGHTDIPLLSDPSFKMSQDYGVLDEKAGVKLRGTFVVDGEGILQQITWNDLAAEGSVSETLRLLETSRAKARHVVQYPIHLELDNHKVDFNDVGVVPLAMLHESRLGDEEASFYDIPITDLDAKYRNEGSGELDSDGKNLHARSVDHSTTEMFNQPNLAPSSTLSSFSKVTMPPSTIPSIDLPSLAPHAASAVEVFRPRTPCASVLSQSKVQGQREDAFPPQDLSKASRQKTSRPLMQSRSNTYQTRRGSHVVLEFAEPMLLGPSTTPYTQPTQLSEQRATSSSPHATMDIRSALSLDQTLGRRGAVQLSPDCALEVPGDSISNEGGRTRLQASLHALKKIGSGIRSPWSENGPKRGEKQGYFE